jgi:hypothetical protein
MLEGSLGMHEKARAQPHATDDGKPAADWRMAFHRQALSGRGKTTGDLERKAPGACGI